MLKNDYDLMTYYLYLYLLTLIKGGKYEKFFEQGFQNRRKSNNN